MATPLLLSPTTQFMDLTVTNSAGVNLDSQPVEVSLDKGVTWYVGAWQGSVAPSRTFSVLVGSGGMPLPAPGMYRVRVKITGNPEIPVIDAGEVWVEA